MLLRILHRYLSCKFNLMEDRGSNEFSWQTLFFVTGISFVLFSLVLKILDGTHSVPMLWISAVSLSLGTVTWVIDIVYKTTSRKKENTHPDLTTGDIQQNKFAVHR